MHHSIVSAGPVQRPSQLSSKGLAVPGRKWATPRQGDCHLRQCSRARLQSACTRLPKQRGSSPARTERGKSRGPSQVGSAEHISLPHRNSARNRGPARQSQDQDIDSRAGRGTSRGEIRSECSSFSSQTSYGMTATERGGRQDAHTWLVHHVEVLGRGGQWPAWKG